MTWEPGAIRTEVRYRYWCPVCRSGGGDSCRTVTEAEAWRPMHERTRYHRDTVAHFLFHHLTR